MLASRINLKKSVFLVFIISLLPMLSSCNMISSCVENYNSTYHAKMEKKYNIWIKIHNKCCDITLKEFIEATVYNRYHFKVDSAWSYRFKVDSAWSKVDYRYNEYGTIHEMVYSYREGDTGLIFSEWIIYKYSQTKHYY